VSADGCLTGIFTDSDLARLFERRRDDDLDRPIRNVMTARPVTVSCGTMLFEAVAIMAQRKISELPVIDPQGRPVGLLDITDLVGVLPPSLKEGSAELASSRAEESRETALRMGGRNAA